MRNLDFRQFYKKKDSYRIYLVITKKYQFTERFHIKESKNSVDITRILINFKWSHKNYIYERYLSHRYINSFLRITKWKFIQLIPALFDPMVWWPGPTKKGFILLCYFFAEYCLFYDTCFFQFNSDWEPDLIAGIN